MAYALTSHANLITSPIPTISSRTSSSLVMRWRGRRFARGWRCHQHEAITEHRERARQRFTLYGEIDIEAGPLNWRYFLILMKMKFTFGILFLPRIGLMPATTFTPRSLRS